MSNQEMQFADPDWKPSQQLDKKASPQEQEAYRPQPINADPREQPWRAAQAAPPQQEGYAGLPPYAGFAPQQMQGRDYRQPQYRRRGRSPWLWLILAIILISLMSGGFRSFNGFDRSRGVIEPQPLSDFKVNGQSTIMINDTDGAIHVVAGNSNNDVTIQAVRQSNFGGPNDVQVKANQNGNTISANVQESGPGSADIIVTVPQNSNLQLTTGSGDITIDSVNGHETVSTGSGSINFDGTIGNGGSYQFQTDSGAVNLNVPGASEFHLVASTNSGSINVPGVSVQKNGLGSGSKASGDIGGNSQGQGPTVTITTGSGDINLNQQ